MSAEDQTCESSVGWRVELDEAVIDVCILPKGHEGCHQAMGMKWNDDYEECEGSRVDG